MKKISDSVVTAVILLLAVGLWLIGKGYIIAAEGSLLCVLTAGVNMAVFLFRVLAMAVNAKGAEKEADFLQVDRLDYFLAKQRKTVKEWYLECYERGKKSCYIWGVAPAAVLVVIGFLAGYGYEKVLTLHPPLGLLLGEIVGICVWPLVRMTKNGWKRALEKMKENIVKDLPSAAAQEGFVSDFLDAGEEWSFEEKNGKSNYFQYGVIGARYWTVINGNGTVCIVNPEKVSHIQSAKEILTVRSNNVRTRTVTYLAECFYRENPERPFCRFSFWEEEKRDGFVQLIQKRTNNEIAVTVREKPYKV